ncbi:hypothetical protein C8Q74DRAFT_1366780 [Fomes fomentarius]|nr:hypothetical protein C8Q74DRAFT_1366780 [Fomes fomentarius]
MVNDLQATTIHQTAGIRSFGVLCSLQGNLTSAIPNHAVYMQAGELHVQQIPAEPPRHGTILGRQRKAIPAPLRLPPFEYCIYFDLASSPVHPRYDDITAPGAPFHIDPSPECGLVARCSVPLDAAILDSPIYIPHPTQNLPGAHSPAAVPHTGKDRIASTGSIGARRAASFSTTKACA